MQIPSPTLLQVVVASVQLLSSWYQVRTRLERALKGEQTAPLRQNGLARSRSLLADATTDDWDSDEWKCRYGARIDWSRLIPTCSPLSSCITDFATKISWHLRFSIYLQNSSSKSSNMRLNPTSTAYRYLEAAPRCWSSLRSVTNSRTLE